MVFKGLFRRSEALVSIDFGASAIKLVELDLANSTPRLANIGMLPVSGEIFTGNTLSRGEKAADIVSALLESNGVEERRVVTAMPGPSVFTKKIKMQKMGLEELASNIQFEAGNFIPHNIDAVKIDFHIIGESGKNQLDILVIAVKNEIIESFVDCVALSGLETAIVDVDYFALQNIFELSYPEHIEDTVALINVGARYSSINICRGGESLFTGDIAVGGKAVTEAVETMAGLSSEEAERMKCQDPTNEAVKLIIEDQVEQSASEFNRQLSFFWSASGAEEGIDRIYITGGGSLIPGLREQLAEKTGLECSVLDPLKGIDAGESFDEALLRELGPRMAIGLGMSLRQPADKITPEFIE
ncbi:MAG: type IV pilus assembly protein PilM [Bdellovibrionales bacterium]|nr:type IV pilus assembly protein PilM [Bdellovibrionales bacterium]